MLGVSWEDCTLREMCQQIDGRAEMISSIIDLVASCLPKVKGATSGVRHGIKPGQLAGTFASAIDR